MTRSLLAAALLALVAALTCVACAPDAEDDSAASSADIVATASATPVQVSAAQRSEVAQKKATCPFAGTAIESGALAILNSAKRPLGFVKDIIALGDSGGGDLGRGVLQTFAKGNHARMAGADPTKLDTAVPEGTFSLDFPGSQGSHPGHSGILQSSFSVVDSGRFSETHFDRLLAHAHGSHIKRSEVGKFIAENLAADPNAKVFGNGVYRSLGGDIFAFVKTIGPALLEKLRNRITGSADTAADTALFEKLTKLTGEDNLVGSAGEYGLLFAFLANSPNTIQVEGEPAIAVADVTAMFEEKRFPAGWETWKKTRHDWLVATTALLHAAASEYLRIR